MSTLSAPRIVCAANRIGNGQVVLGARHFDGLMRMAIESRHQINPNEDWRPSEQGFVDQHGVFYTREDAWIIACKENQIKDYVGSQSPEDNGIYGAKLYSENLY